MCGLRERGIEDYLAQGAGRLVLSLSLKIHEKEKKNTRGRSGYLYAHLFGNVCSPV